MSPRPVYGVGVGARSPAVTPLSVTCFVLHSPSRSMEPPVDVFDGLLSV